MKNARSLEILYGILVVPPFLVILAAWAFVFWMAQSQPANIPWLTAAFVVWSTFAIESFNRLFFNRRALPWLPILPSFLPLELKFIPLAFAYVVFGFVGYKLATEPW